MYIHGDNIVQCSVILHIHIMFAYIHGAASFAPLAPLAPLAPFAPLSAPLSLTWHPPAVTGIVLLRLRLLINWPYLPHPSPIVPPSPVSQNPGCPAPDNDDLGTNPLLLCGTIGFLRNRVSLFRFPRQMFLFNSAKFRWNIMMNQKEKNSLKMHLGQNSANINPEQDIFI
jgi:hypothetical protein